jgi:hypothetical protein
VPAALVSAAAQADAPMLDAVWACVAARTQPVAVAQAWLAVLHAAGPAAACAWRDRTYLRHGAPTVGSLHAWAVLGCARDEVWPDLPAALARACNQLTLADVRADTLMQGAAALVGVALAAAPGPALACLLAATAERPEVAAVLRAGLDAQWDTDARVRGAPVPDPAHPLLALAAAATWTPTLAAAGAGPAAARAAAAALGEWFASPALRTTLATSLVLPWLQVATWTEAPAQTDAALLLLPTVLVPDTLAGHADLGADLLRALAALWPHLDRAAASGDAWADVRAHQVRTALGMLHTLAPAARGAGIDAATAAAIVALARTLCAPPRPHPPPRPFFSVQVRCLEQPCAPGLSITV